MRFCLTAFRRDGDLFAQFDIERDVALDVERSDLAGRHVDIDRRLAVCKIGACVVIRLLERDVRFKARSPV